jgi:hypothetical protein
MVLYFIFSPLNEPDTLEIEQNQGLGLYLLDGVLKSMI